MYPIRHHIAERPKAMGPLSEKHPAVVMHQHCAACWAHFEVGDMVALIALGPGDHKSEHEKAAAGGWYDACGALVHWACATGEEHAKTK